MGSERPPLKRPARLAPHWSRRWTLRRAKIASARIAIPSIASASFPPMDRRAAASPSVTLTRSERSRDPVRQLGLREQPDLLALHLAVLDEDERRNRDHAEPHRGGGRLLHVHRPHLEATLELAGQLFHDRLELLAGAAPRAREIEEHRLLGLHHLSVEIALVDLDHVRHVVLILLGTARAVE